MFQPPTQASSTQGPLAAPLQPGTEPPARKQANSMGAVGSLSSARILQLQKTIGNRAVAQMLQQQRAAQLNKSKGKSAEQDKEQDKEQDPEFNLTHEMFKHLANNLMAPDVAKPIIESFIKLVLGIIGNQLTAMGGNVVAAIKIVLAVLASFREAVNFWQDLNPNVRAVLKYGIGVVLYKFDEYMGKYVKQTEVHQSFETYAADDNESPEWVKSFSHYFNIVEKSVGYADGVKRATNWVYAYLTSGTKESTPEPGDTAKSLAPIDKQPNNNPPKNKQPKSRTVDLKLIKLDLQDLTIAKTEKDEDDPKKIEKLGGLDSKSAVTLRLFGKEYRVDEIHARLDWGMNFAIDATFNNKKIVDRSDFLIFQLENLILNQLTVGNKGLETLEIGIGKFKAGDLLSLADAKGRYQKGEGYNFEAGQVALNFPSPFETSISAGVELQLGPNGDFEKLVISSFQAGNFTWKSAEVNNAHLEVKDVKYNLQETYGIPLILQVNKLLINEQKQVEKFETGVEVEKWEVLKGLTVKGALLAGYDGRLYLRAAGAMIALDKGIVHGYGAIEELTYDEDKTVTGKMSQLSFSIGMFALDAENVVINKDGSVSIKKARGIIGKQEDTSSSELDKVLKPEDKEQLQERMQGEKNKRNSGPMIGVEAEDILIQDGEFTYKKWQTKTSLGDVYKLSLFGGSVKGMIDKKEGKASLYGKVDFPKKGGLWPLEIGATLPLPPTPISLFVNAEIDGGISATVNGDVSKVKSAANDPVYNINARASLDASLIFSLGAGVKLGHEVLLALRAYLKASAILKASTSASVEGQVRLDEKSGTLVQDDAKPVQFRYQFDAELKAQIQAIVDLVAFLVYKKKLYSKTLVEWTLGTYHMEGTVGERKGEMVNAVETPKKGGGQDETLGGAVPGKIKPPDDKLVNELMYEDELANVKQSDVKDDQLLYRVAHTQLSKCDEITDEKILEVNKQLRSVADPTVPDDMIAKLVGQAEAFINERRKKFKSLLMTKEEWVQYSYTKDKRVTILPVDKELYNYHRAQRVDEKKKILLKLRALLHEYCQGSFKSRKSMAKRLWLDTFKEERRLHQAG
ncbi:hypothetical protein [Tumebacillus flagellatus]|uniref:Uncharacterized protein n=1 Tax=Tumebacillus flagellatus TaxID=1157490 RepID=A0A074LP79_9BACL|nr:hypothetical protein [Tumebacillus flagellatus]KEO83971.1 hypothetical protein EL26_07230 [Tumebacillus flagellatus]